jgi:hypothetical protein
MKFHKNINNKIIAVLGTWDPVLPRHTALFRELLRYSKKQGLNPYIFIFYPNPANYIHENRYKDYFDLDARIELFKHLGINNVIVLDFDREDLLQTSGDFLNALSNNTGITLTELWVGENQSFGRGPEGILSIRTECANRNIRLRILKNSFLVNLEKDDVYKNFKQGKFDLTAAVVGYFPTYKLNAAAQINMHDGEYSAALRISPFQKTNEIPITIKIANQIPDEIKVPDGYIWLVLFEKINE